MIQLRFIDIVNDNVSAPLEYPVESWGRNGTIDRIVGDLNTDHDGPQTLDIPCGQFGTVERTRELASRLFRFDRIMTHDTRSQATNNTSRRDSIAKNIVRYDRIMLTERDYYAKRIVLYGIPHATLLQWQATMRAPRLVGAMGQNTLEYNIERNLETLVSNECDSTTFPRSHPLNPVSIIIQHCQILARSSGGNDDAVVIVHLKNSFPRTTTTTTDGDPFVFISYTENAEVPTTFVSRLEPLMYSKEQSMLMVDDQSETPFDVFGEPYRDFVSGHGDDDDNDSCNSLYLLCLLASFFDNEVALDFITDAIGKAVEQCKDLDALRQLCGQDNDLTDEEKHRWIERYRRVLPPSFLEWVLPHHPS